MKKNKLTVHYNTDEFKIHYSKRKKPDLKSYTFPNSIYMNSPKGNPVETQNISGVARD